MGIFDSIINVLDITTKTPEELYGEDLLKLMNIALSDGVLTRKERELLISSAKNDNRDAEAFTKYLDETIAKRNIVIKDQPLSIETKTSRLGGKASQLQTLVDMALTDREISPEERTLLTEEARKLGLNIQDFNRVLDILVQQTKKQHIDWSKSVIETLTTIDYDTIIKGLTVAMVIPPLITPCLVLSPILLILKGAAIEYNQSTQPNRDELYLSYLWNNTSPERIIGAIKPVEKYIPFSGIIIKGVETFMDTF